MPATASNIRTARIVPGASSKTYKALPLDTRLTVPEVFAHHAKNSPDHTYFVYADNHHIEGISYSQLYAAQLKVACVVAKESKNAAGLHSSDSRDRPVIGVLAVTDSITYGTLTVGIMQSGAIPFTISTRNSAAAIAHLYRTTGIRQVFVSDDRAMQALSKEASDILAKEDYVVQTIELPLFSALFNDQPTPELRAVRLWESSHEDTAIILHSSGTSSFPKPIRISHHAQIAVGTSFYFGEVDPCGHRLGLHAAPMFHALGSFMQSIAMMTGMELAVSKPQNPPVVPNADSLLAGLVQSESDWVLTVPALLEEWSRDPEAIETLKHKSHVKRIMTGGGPLSRAAGDHIVSHGIHIDNVYGLTEAGLLNLEIVKENSPLSKEWEYFRFPPTDALVIELVSHGNGLVEPVVMAEEYYYPSVINTHINGKPGFATGDLLQPHPTIEGAYKIHGRADEQIMLSTGEKTNPVPLERILHTDPNVVIALFFGRGRFYNGVLIQPSQPLDSKDEEKLAAFRSKIWPTVQKMNDYAPTHSRLLKEMIIVTNPTKPLELTAKGSVRRNVCLAQYESEIEELYKVVDESSGSAPPAPSEWTPEATLSFVRSLVQKVLQKKLDDADDLFQHGSDSLNATWIRNSVLKTLRGASITVPTRQIPQTFVYQHPSIRALSDYIYKIVTGDEAEADEESILSRKMAAMQEMVAKYSSNFCPPRVSTGPAPVQETVVVTGTTGRLGSHLLEQYIRDPTVCHVYALNRGSSRDADPAAGLRSRQKAAFAQWEIDTGLLDSDKVTILPSDYADEHLGLDDATYAEIEGTVTTIVHNAWRVDFNVGLSGFEPLVAGVRHIVDLAANAAVSGGARVLFVSSISVLFRHPSDVAALEQPITDPRISTSMGYGESKWVSETVILNARKQVGLRGGVVRVGQISGDTRVGAWNKQEWVGAMARVGQIVNALPICEDIISWVPVDITAATLIEMARSDEPVLHLVSPQPVSWDTVFGAFSRRLGVPLIPYSEWAALVAAAAEANTNEEDVSALALSDFFQAGSFGDGIEITTKKAVRVSSALANMRPLSEEDALKYLAFWKKIGHLKF